MGTSKHRKNHKRKVQIHKQKVQEKRVYIKKLVDQLEVAMLSAEMDQEMPTVQIDQPILKITGQ